MTTRSLSEKVRIWLAVALAHIVGFGALYLMLPRRS